jgi:hypothetical protein
VLRIRDPHLDDSVLLIEPAVKGGTHRPQLHPVYVYEAAHLATVATTPGSLQEDNLGVMRLRGGTILAVVG